MSSEFRAPQLPERWGTASFEDVFNSPKGRLIKVQKKECDENGSVPVVDQGQAFIGGYTKAGNKYFGPIPVIVFGDHTRTLKYVDFEFAVGADGTKLLHPNGAFDPKFIYYYLKSVEIYSKGYSRHFKVLRQISFPVLGKGEQKRVVEKVDECLRLISEAKERLERIPELLRKFRQSVLRSAFSPVVSVSSDTAGNHFSEMPLGDCSEIIDPNPSHRYPSYKNGTVPILAAEQFSGRDGWEIGSAKLAERSFFEERKKAHGFSSDDIIFARKGRLGFSRRPPKISEYVFSHTVFIIRAKGMVSSDYLMWFLRQDSCIEWLLLTMNSNTGVPTLGKGILQQLLIRFPAEDEIQKRIVQRVELLFELADHVQARYEVLKSLLDRLTQSVLNAAFEGRLVPLDPSDESVSLLLEQIKRNREEMANCQTEKYKRLSGGAKKAGGKVKAKVVSAKRKYRTRTSEKRP